MKVTFYENAEDELLKFAVIVSRCAGKWVFCKHKERNTYEVPGGHREKGETIMEAAKRELIEETGASQFSITPICAYSVTGKTRVNESGDETFGMLYYAQISAFGNPLNSEMEKMELFENLPEALTYPEIQPTLVAHVIRSCE